MIAYSFLLRLLMSINKHNNLLKKYAPQLLFAIGVMILVQGWCLTRIVHEQLMCYPMGGGRKHIWQNLETSYYNGVLLMVVGCGVICLGLPNRWWHKYKQD